MLPEGPEPYNKSKETSPVLVSVPDNVAQGGLWIYFRYNNTSVYHKPLDKIPTLIILFVITFCHDTVLIVCQDEPK